MDLAFNLLLILLVELPIIAFFFRKRKRKSAVIVGLLVNVVTWPLMNIIRRNTNWDLTLVQVGVAIVEGIGYYFFLGRNLKKAIILTVCANLASFIATKYIVLPPDLFQKKYNIVR